MTFKRLMKEADMTAVRLSKIIGVNNQTVGNWIKGRTTPNAIMLRKISRALGKPIHVVANAFAVTAGGEK